MATLEYIRFTPHAAELVEGKVRWTPLSNGIIERMPQICWEHGEPWREANLWFLDRSHRKDIATIRSAATSLHAYAKWLETTKPRTHWWDFPAKEADRCLVRYRGALIHERDAGRLAPSTVSNRMRVAVQFYRWLRLEHLLSPKWPMWKERSVGIRLIDAWGFERTITVMSTDLAIPNRKRNSSGLEDSLTPVSAAERESILNLSNEHCSLELSLMLQLGFSTGMRLGSICDLKVRTITNAIPEPFGHDAGLIAIGPNAAPPVHTKFRTYGHVLVPGSLLNDLNKYRNSPRRLERQARAAPENKQLLFLTRFGNPYLKRGSDKSSAVNVEMHKLRAVARLHGVNLDYFRFHQSRVTFACDAVGIANEVEGIDPVEVVGDMLFQKNRATTEAYIKYVKKQPVKAAVANEFTKVFLGILERRKESKGA
jgi:Site-specific recombinase XerD